VALKLEKLWAHNITLTTRLVETVTTPMLLKTVVAGRLLPRKLITFAAHEKRPTSAQQKRTRL
jgi:alcohol dehydrogenase